MKSFTALVFAGVLLAGCGKAPEPAATPASTATPGGAAAPAAATGVVQSVDATARTVTIAHGDVPALGWPGMTMTFQAPDADLASIRAGDDVAFEFTWSGKDATIVALRKQ